MNTNTTKLAIVLLTCAIALSLVPSAAADHDGDPIPDDVERQQCTSPLGQTLLGPGGLGVCQNGDLVLDANPGGLTGDDDGDGVPDEAEVVICDLAVLPGGMCNGDDLSVLAFPMETVVGPVCDTAGESAPQEVCILRFLTLGQAVCLVRAMAPGNGAILICSFGGSITPHCSEEGSATALLSKMLSDLDCDGHGNEFELNNGCDPADPQSVPTGEMECSEGTGSGISLGCSESEDPIRILAEIVTDADCDGHGNEFELTEGCDPTDPSEYPGGPRECSFLALPSPDDLPVPPV